MHGKPHHSRTWSAWWLRAALVSTPHCSQVWGSPGTSASRMHSPSRASPRAKAEHLPRAMHQEQGRRQARSTEQGCFAPRHEDLSICSHPAPAVSPSRSCPVPRCPHGPARWRGRCPSLMSAPQNPSGRAHRHPRRNIQLDPAVMEMEKQHQHRVPSQLAQLCAKPGLEESPSTSSEHPCTMKAPRQQEISC